jgi:hypothetical protein
VLAAPWLASSSAPVGSRLSALSYLVGGLVCHQRSGRSFHLAGAQLPVCARCTALYLGGAAFLLIALLVAAVGRREPVSVLAARWGWRRVVGAALVPLLLTIVLEWAGAWTVSNAWRAALSLPAAVAAGALVAESLSFRVTL